MINNGTTRVKGGHPLAINKHPSGGLTEGADGTAYATQKLLTHIPASSGFGGKKKPAKAALDDCVCGSKQKLAADGEEEQ